MCAVRIIECESIYGRFLWVCECVCVRVFVCSWSPFFSFSLLSSLHFFLSLCSITVKSTRNLFLWIVARLMLMFKFVIRLLVFFVEHTGRCVCVRLTQSKYVLFFQKKMQTKTTIQLYHRTHRAVCDLNRNAWARKQAIHNQHIGNDRSETPKFLGFGKH